MAYEYLLCNLEEAMEKIDQYTEPEHFRVNVQLAWEKINECYERLDNTTMYCAALAFYPAFGWKVIEREWDTRPEWVRNAKEMVKRVWEDSYSKLEIALTSGEPVAKRRKTFHNKFSQFKEDKRRIAWTSPSASPLEADSDVSDPYQYWHSRRQQFPRLSVMALDFISIPPMSAGETVFGRRAYGCPDSEPTGRSQHNRHGSVSPLLAAFGTSGRAREHAACHP